MYFAIASRKNLFVEIPMSLYLFRKASFRDYHVLVLECDWKLDCGQ